MNIRYPIYEGVYRILTQKQDLFINSMLAQIGCDVLWRMLREGRTFYRGAYLNLDTLRVNPIPV